MDPKCLDYCLTEAEARKFKRDGYFIVPDALPPRHGQRSRRCSRSRG